VRRRFGWYLEGHWSFPSNDSRPSPKFLITSSTSLASDLAKEIVIRCVAEQRLGYMAMGKTPSTNATKVEFSAFDDTRVQMAKKTGRSIPRDIQTEC